ncbi:MAG TPA: DUF4426 domain-containing protein [Thiobacillaceae bacterium]|nr:DUF4426 domain-containing protein [Thiobacillaceae bacterium]
MFIRMFLLMLAVAALPAQAETFHQGDLEVVVNAIPATELTAQASESYNVTREAGRGLLTIAVNRTQGSKTIAVPAQIYAGALNQNNNLINIPVRELRDQSGVHYLGEFRLNGSNALTFLVNVNVLGKLVKAEFSRLFPAQ